MSCATRARGFVLVGAQELRRADGAHPRALHDDPACPLPRGGDATFRHVDHPLHASDDPYKTVMNKGPVAAHYSLYVSVGVKKNLG